MDIVNFKLIKQKKNKQMLERVETGFWEWIFSEVWIPCHCCSSKLMGKNDEIDFNDILCESCLKKYTYIRKAWLLICNTIEN